MRKISFLFYLFLIAGFHSHAAGPEISYYILEDKGRNVSAAQALDSFQHGKYILQHDHQFNPGFTRSVYWLAVKADSALTDSLVLVIGQTVINKIEFYAVAGNRPGFSLKQGTITLTNSARCRRRSFVFPFQNNPVFISYG
jgi:hypothetical protein